MLLEKHLAIGDQCVFSHVFLFEFYVAIVASSFLELKWKNILFSESQRLFC